MNEGVRILLERIKTHPEEFMKGGRWINLISEYNEYIPEELKPIITETRNLVKDEFTRDVIKELINGGEQSDEQWVDSVLNKKLAVMTKYGKLMYDSIETSS